MRLLLAQLNSTVGDFSGNYAKIIKVLKKARKDSFDLVIFPELMITGYPARDLLLQPHFIQHALEVLDEIVAHSQGIGVVVGVPRLNPDPRKKPLFNSAAVIEDGVLLGFQDKVLLPTYDVFNEDRYFEPANQNMLWKIAGKNAG